MEDYNEDFATVLKVKGENFEEDTGGIWYDVHQTQAYNIDTVNAKLAGMHFTKVSMAERDRKMVKHIFEMKENYNKFRQLFRQQAEDLLKKLDKQAEEKQKSVMHDMMDEWSCFCKGQDKAFVCRRAPQKTSREMFMCLTEKEASDYAKHLKISEDELAGREVRDVVAETLRLHPEYYLYVFDKHDITQLQKFQKFEENKKYQMAFDTVGRAIALGLLSVKAPEGTQAAYLFPASDFDEIFSSILNLDWKKICKRIQDISAKFEKVLLSYGMIEMDAFYQIFTNAWGEQLSKEEFERYVYWHGNFGMHFKTMTHAYTGEKFAVMCDMDAVSIVEKRDKYAKNLPYRKFSAKEMEEIATYSSKSDECWHMLGETLHDQYGYDVEETEEMIDHLRKIVMEGNGVQELWDIFQDEESTLMEQVEMWQCLLNAELETHLPMLNGYSRMEYEKKTGTNAFSIMLFDENGLDKDIKRDTGLQKLPLKTQEMIYRAFFENIIGKDRIKALEQVKKKIQTENDGLNFLIGMCYMAIEKYSKANSIIEEIADRTQDESAFAMFDMMDDSLETAMYGNDYYYDEWDAFAGVGMNEPYQREKKKIGRNDPCPCGSGKKYKKCCGR